MFIEKNTYLQCDFPNSEHFPKRIPYGGQRSAVCIYGCTLRSPHLPVSVCCGSHRTLTAPDVIIWQYAYRCIVMYLNAA
ncbi:MAG: hypothetical protein IKJ87_00575 [Ruminococcus sp.]|nr:hypothetical protein [Ruminococcus sp.]